MKSEIFFFGGGGGAGGGGVGVGQVNQLDIGVAVMFLLKQVERYHVIQHYVLSV